MDVSPQYVKMCDQAVEIQEQAPTKCSDFPVTNCLRIFTDICGEWWADRVNKPSWWYERKGEIVCYDPLYVWLPRQDELQEMVNDKSALWPTVTLARRFLQFIESWQDLTHIPSMEQLWLAFVMKEKWGKVWVNGDWVKDGH